MFSNHMHTLPKGDFLYSLEFSMCAEYAVEDLMIYEDFGNSWFLCKKFLFLVALLEGFVEPKASL